MTSDSAAGPPVDTAITASRGSVPGSVVRLRARRGDQLAAQLVADLRQVDRHLARRLGDEVDRAGGERVERLARALGGMRREHHDRRRLGRHDVANGLRAVHPRHVEVHRHDVGRQPLDLGERGRAVLGLADDVERPGGERLADRGAHEQRVVDDQHADTFLVCHARSPSSDAAIDSTT
jgi:hypothetical protein